MPPAAERGVALQASLPQGKASIESVVPVTETLSRRPISTSVPVAVPGPEETAKPAPTPTLASVTPPVAVAEKPASPPAQPAPASSPPKPLRVVSPSYPVGALRDGITGKVDMDFRIGADGSVQDIRVVSARPAGVFEQAAIAALRQWRFESPALPEAARYTRSFAFTRGASPSEPCREVTGSHICRGPDSDNKTN